jgi:hypothetical protein
MCDVHACKQRTMILAKNLLKLEKLRRNYLSIARRNDDAVMHVNRHRTDMY